MGHSGTSESPVWDPFWAPSGSPLSAHAQITMRFICRTAQDRYSRRSPGAAQKVIKWTQIGAQMGPIWGPILAAHSPNPAKTRGLPGKYRSAGSTHFEHLWDRGTPVFSGPEHYLCAHA